MSSAQAVGDLVSQPYKYGFVTDIETEKIAKGLSEDVVRLISSKKEEPAFLLEFRLRAYRQWLQMQEPDWATDRKSTRLNSSHIPLSRMPSSA